MLFTKSNQESTPDIKTRKGFEEVYRRYARRMYTLVLSKTNDEEISREIVQNIFKSIWERRESLVLRISWENYLMRAVKLEIIDYYRIKDQRVKHLESALSAYCESENSTENQVLFGELQERFNLLMDRLPKQCRNVFKMSREKGYTNKAIATQLLISERAVEFHITKALAFLKQNLVEKD